MAAASAKAEDMREVGARVELLLSCSGFTKVELCTDGMPKVLAGLGEIDDAVPGPGTRSGFVGNEACEIELPEERVGLCGVGAAPAF